MTTQGFACAAPPATAVKWYWMLPPLATVELALQIQLLVDPSSAQTRERSEQFSKTQIVYPQFLNVGKQRAALLAMALMSPEHPYRD